LIKERQDFDRQREEMSTALTETRRQKEQIEKKMEENMKKM